MILNFSVTNTLSIRDFAEISFEADGSTSPEHIIKIGNKEILRLKCLYGDNASGKTNIIEAFAFYLNFLLHSFSELKPDENTHFIPFRFSDEKSNEPGSFKIIFYMDSIKYEYSILLDKKRVHKEELFFSPNGQKSLLFERKFAEIVWGPAFRGQKKILKESVRENSSLISAGAQLNNQIFLKIYKELSSSFKGCVFPEKGSLLGLALKRLEKDNNFKKQVVSLLSKINSNSITDIRIESELIPEDYLQDLPQELKEKFLGGNSSPKKRKALMLHSLDKIYELPLGLESRGTQRLVELAAPLYDLVNGNSIVFIDELETSLHEKTQESFLKYFLNSRTNSQLLFTTHNTDLMDYGILNDDEICFAIKDKTGNTTISSITDYTGVRKGVSRKHLYENGKFDELPQKAK